MKFNYGKTLQLLGVFIAIFGFMIMGSIGYLKLQVPIFIAGVIVSIVGFYIVLGIPPQERKIHVMEVRYKTLCAKNIAFAKRITLLIFCIFLGCHDIDFNELISYLSGSTLIFISLSLVAIVIASILSDYKDIYKNG